VPPACSASESASADLPLAVGPAMSASGGCSEDGMFIATLIAKDRLSRGDISAARDAVGGADSSWVEPERACDLLLGPEPGAARAALEGLLPNVDVVVQPQQGRRRRLLVADMDSTMITVECIDELADYAGVKAEVAAVTERAMQGELDFEGALDARVALLKGLDAGMIDRCHEERVRLTPGARTLVRTMRAHGAWCLLVSGGFSLFADRVAAAIGFDEARSNDLHVSDGLLTGTVGRPVIGAEGKRRALLEAAAARGLAPADALAVGDGANDIPMLREAGLGIAYHAKPAAMAAADARIDANDLSALLFAQGYSVMEWTAD
jgi:phosphoserine phosphatase